MTTETSVISVVVPLNNDSYTLHGTRTGTGNGIGTVENNGSMFLSLSLCSVYIT